MQRDLGPAERKREFLDEMNPVVPWSELVGLVQPHAPAGNGRDQSVVIAFNVEDHAAVLQHARAAVLRFDVSRLLPCRARSLLVPCLQGLLGVGMAI